MYEHIGIAYAKPTNNKWLLTDVIPTMISEDREFNESSLSG